MYHFERSPESFATDACRYFLAPMQRVRYAERTLRLPRHAHEPRALGTRQGNENVRLARVCAGRESGNLVLQGTQATMNRETILDYLLFFLMTVIVIVSLCIFGWLLSDVAGVFK
jgi:hypothetical protein